MAHYSPQLEFASRAVGSFAIKLTGHEQHGSPSELDTFMQRLDPLAIDFPVLGSHLRGMMVRAVASVDRDRLNESIRDALTKPDDHVIRGTPGEIMILLLALESFNALPDFLTDVIKDRIERDDSFYPADEIFTSLCSMMRGADWSFSAKQFWGEWQEQIARHNNN